MCCDELLCAVYELELDESAKGLTSRRSWCSRAVVSEQAMRVMSFACSCRPE